MTKTGSLKLDDFVIDIFTQYSENQTPLNINFLQKQQDQFSKNDYFLDLQFASNPKDSQEDLRLLVDMKSIEVLYNPLAVYRLKNFFDVHTTDESIIDAAWEQYAYAQNYSA